MKDTKVASVQFEHVPGDKNLYLQDGVWNGERLLPEGFAGFVATLSACTSTTECVSRFRAQQQRCFCSMISRPRTWSSPNRRRWRCAPSERSQ